jgi:hypothetical protein
MLGPCGHKSGKIDACLEDLRLAKRPAGTISDKQLHLRLFTSLANKQSLANYGRADALRMKDLPRGGRPRSEDHQQCGVASGSPTLATIVHRDKLPTHWYRRLIAPC